MKFFPTAFAVGLALIGAAGIASASPISTRSSKVKNSTAFVKTRGRLFDIDGKGVSYLSGTNAWWLSHIMNDSDVDDVLRIISEADLKVVRVYGFGSVNKEQAADNVYFQMLNASGSFINEGPNGIPRLDSVVRLAEKYNIKLIIPFINNWIDFGGIPSYNDAFGGTDTTWWTDNQSQDVYKDYVKYIINRYKNSTAIFSWVLANEPRCKGCPSSVITNWATEISQYVKSLDPNRLVALGDEGFFAKGSGIGDNTYAYSGIEGIDWIANLAIPTLDYGNMHLYPASWGYEAAWGNDWIKQHDSVAANHSKPVVLEEYGGLWNGNHSEVGWQKTVLEDTNIAIDLFWQFGYQKLKDFGDGLSLYPTDWAYDTMMKDHAMNMLAKKVPQRI